MSHTIRIDRSRSFARLEPKSPGEQDCLSGLIVGEQEQKSLVLQELDLDRLSFQRVSIWKGEKRFGHLRHLPCILPDVQVFLAIVKNAHLLSDALLQDIKSGAIVSCEGTILYDGSCNACIPIMWWCHAENKMVYGVRHFYEGFPSRFLAAIISL